MKYLLASAVLAILLCSISIEATSEPVCVYEGETLRRGQDFIQFKKPSGCDRKVTCDAQYKTVKTECDRTLFPADKALKEDLFPDCCFY